MTTSVLTCTAASQQLCTAANYEHANMLLETTRLPPGLAHRLCGTHCKLKCDRKDVIWFYLLRLEALRLLLALLLMLLLRSDTGERFFGDGERSALARGDTSLLPFATSGSGLDMLALCLRHRLNSY